MNKAVWHILLRNCHQRCSVKKVFLEISQNSQENGCVRVYFLIKLQAWGLQFYLKRDSDTGFSCEFCEISKNTCFLRTPLVAASSFFLYYLVTSGERKLLQLLTRTFAYKPHYLQRGGFIYISSFFNNEKYDPVMYVNPIEYGFFASRVCLMGGRTQKWIQLPHPTPK